MEADFLREFIDSTATVLEGVLKTEVRAGRVYYKSTPLPEAAVPAALRLAGKETRRIYLDMEEETARRLASAWVQQELSFDDDRTRPSLEAIARRIGMGRVEVVPVLSRKLPGGATHHAESALVVPFEMKDGGWISLDVEVGMAGGGRKAV